MPSSGGEERGQPQPRADCPPCAIAKKTRVLTLHAVCCLALALQASTQSQRSLAKAQQQQNQITDRIPEPPVTAPEAAGYRCVRGLEGRRSHAPRACLGVRAPCSGGLAALRCVLH